MNGHRGYQAPPTTTVTATPPDAKQQSLNLLAGIKVELEEVNNRMEHAAGLYTDAADANDKAHDAQTTLLRGIANLLHDLPGAVAEKLAELLKGLPATAPAAAAPAGALAPAGESIIETIECTHIVKSMKTNGDWQVAVMGGPYQQFGIPIYPEYWPRFGIDINSLPNGRSPWDHRIRVEMRYAASGKRVPARALSFASNEQDTP